MIVQKLKMYNFRCFSSFEIVFSNKINIAYTNNYIKINKSLQGKKLFFRTKIW